MSDMSPARSGAVDPAEGPAAGSGSVARPAGPRTARLINDRRAYDLLLERGPLTRTELRALTGLASPTVGELVERLEQSGLIGVVGESGERRRGPNARLYGVVPDRALVVGVEIRGNTVLASAVNVIGEEVAASSDPLDTGLEPDRIVIRAVSSVLDSAGYDVDRLGALVVGTPGLVDPSTGDITYAASLPTFHSNLLPGLRRAFDVPVVVENEVNLVGLAELRRGAARGRDSFALLWLDIGIGLAIVHEGRLLRGMSGGAGEVSYVPVGSDDTLQGLLGGEAVADPEAYAETVALGATAICSVLDPGLLVLGGRHGRAGGTRLASLVEERLRERLPVRTEVVPAELSGNPVLRGAVLVGLDAVHDQAFV